MNASLQLLCIYEDRAFEDVVTPLLLRLGAQCGVSLAPLLVTLTHGCRFGALTRAIEAHGPTANLLIVGADAGKLTATKKEVRMRKRLGTTIADLRRVFAVPEPSAEGWLQADPAALKAGIAEALKTKVTLAHEIGAYPKDEAHAKARLRDLLRGANLPSLRDGLEYGPSVMRYTRYESHPSLQRFVNAFRQQAAQAAADLVGSGSS
jgi:hypothetical protein